MLVDIFVLIVVLGSMIISFFRGFIREVLTILSIVGGLIASYIGGPLFIPYISDWLGIVEGEKVKNLFGVLPYPLLANILSYGGVLILFTLILTIISYYIAKFVSDIGLGALDRTLGIVFGFARAVLLLGLLYLPFFYLAGDKQKDEWFKDSKSRIYLVTVASWIDSYMPSNMDDNMKENSKIVKDISETRKKLEDMNLLKNKSDNLNDSSNGDNLNNKQDSKKDGYDHDFRKNMDKLFEETTDNPSNFND